MKKVIGYVSGAFLAAGALLYAGPCLAETLMLKPNVMVADNVVRLGDIFENAGRKGAAVVAPAPALGRKATYDSTWLSTVTRANGLNWKPRSVFEHVTVERATRTYDITEIESVLMNAVAKKFKNRRFEAEVDNRAMKIYAPFHSDGQLKVKNLSTNLNTGRFDAVLVITGKEAVRQKSHRVSGQIHEIVEIPVLADQVKPGEVIAEGNLDWVPIRSNALQRNTLTDADKIVGMSLKRWHRTGEPLRSSDLGRPVMIEKGTPVLMVLSTPSLTITAQGRAIEDGSEGDVIRVTNTHSKMVVDAIVEAPGRVRVSAGSHEAKQAQQAWAEVE